MAETSKVATQKGPSVSPEEKHETLYVDFLFFKVESAFRRLPAPEKEAGVRAFREILRNLPPEFKARPYLSLGYRPETDFLLWVITRDLGEVQSFVGKILQTGLGKYLNLVYSYAAVRQPPLYAPTHQQQFEKDEPPRRFLFGRDAHPRPSLKTLRLIITAFQRPSKRLRLFRLRNQGRSLFGRGTNTRSPRSRRRFMPHPSG